MLKSATGSGLRQNSCAMGWHWDALESVAKAYCRCVKALGTHEFNSYTTQNCVQGIGASCSEDSACLL